MEIPKAIKVAELVSAAVVVVGSMIGWRYLEQQSQKPSLLSIGNKLELWGACAPDYLNTIMNDGEMMTPLYVPGRYYILIKSTNQLADDIESGKVTEPKLNIRGRVDNPPGTFNAQVETHHRPKKEKDNSLIRNLAEEEIETLESLEATLTCPTQIPYGAIDFGVRHIRAWLNPGQPTDNVIQFGETKST